MLYECVLLSRAWPYQGPRCLRPMGMARSPPGQALGNGKAFPWSQCAEKGTNPSFLLLMTAFRDCSPTETPLLRLASWSLMAGASPSERASSPQDSGFSVLFLYSLMSSLIKSKAVQVMAQANFFFFQTKISLSLWPGTY